MTEASTTTLPRVNPPPFPPQGRFRALQIAAVVIRLRALGWSEEDAGEWAQEAEAHIPSPSDSFPPTPGAQ